MTGDVSNQFNLLDEPWLPVLDLGGRQRTVSLTEAFVEADRLRSLCSELPTMNFALTRLMLAIAQRAFVDSAPLSLDDVRERLEEIHTDWPQWVALVTDYLEEFRDRFWLFHGESPFLQNALLRTARGEVSDLSKLVADVPNGAPFLTLRSRRNLRSITPAEAARWLVHAQAYDPSGIKTGVVGHPRAKGGKVYPDGVGWTGQLGGICLLGNTLLNTLVLNLWATLQPSEILDVDLPPWERPVPSLDDLARPVHRPAGVVDLYTWMPRHILLARDGPNVGGVIVTYSHRFIIQDRQDLVKIEPMTLWRHSAPQTKKYRAHIQMPRKPAVGSTLWRGLANILPRDTPRAEDDPALSQIVVHAERLRGSPLLPDGLVRLSAVSMEYGSNDSVVDEIIFDQLDLPAAILSPDQAELRQVALRAVEAADEGAKALAHLARNLAQASGGSGDSLVAPRERARQNGFAILDPLYRGWLRETLAASEEQPLVAEREWHIAALRELSRLGDELISAVPDKAWKGYGSNGPRMEVGQAAQCFHRALYKALPRAVPEGRRESGGSQ
ncbi:MAG: type I-E CRISPR-associated protein Cse1/CasA [Candidatus Nanopelagicales bacterium]